MLAVSYNLDAAQGFKQISSFGFSMNLQDEQQLVENAKADSESFGKLYDFYFPKVYPFVAAKVGNQNDAEDLTSEIFMKVLENLPKFEWRGLPFGAWIFRIARNALNDFYDKNGRNKTTNIDEVFDLSESEEKVSPHSKASKEELAVKVKQVLKKLPDRELNVVLLKFYSGLKNREIVEVTGLSERNVAVILHRTLHRIKPDLQYFHNYI